MREIIAEIFDLCNMQIITKTKKIIPLYIIRNYRYNKYVRKIADFLYF